MSSILLSPLWLSARDDVRRFLLETALMPDDHRATLLAADRALAPDRYDDVENLVLTRADDGREIGTDQLDLLCDARAGQAYRALMESTQSRSAPAALFAIVAARAGAITPPDYRYLTRGCRWAQIPAMPAYFPGSPAEGESAISSVLPIEGDVVDVDAHLRAAGVNPEEWRSSEPPIAELLSVTRVEGST